MGAVSDPKTTTPPCWRAIRQKLATAIQARYLAMGVRRGLSYDKRSTYRVAQKFRHRIPATFYPRDCREVETLECRFPVILKPAIKN